MSHFRPRVKLTSTFFVSSPPSSQLFLPLSLQNVCVTGSLTLSAANIKPLKVKLQRLHIPPSLFTHPAAPTLSSHPIYRQSNRVRSAASQLTELLFTELEEVSSLSSQQTGDEIPSHHYSFHVYSLAFGAGVVLSSLVFIM